MPQVFQVLKIHFAIEGTIGKFPFVFDDDVAGLGLRRLRENVFEFRISRGIRVVFLFFKPNRLQLMMTGNHDEVRAWLKENV